MSEDCMKAEMMSDESIDESIYVLHAESLPFLAEKEDASTQTSSLKRLSSAESPTLSECAESEEVETADISSCDTVCWPARWTSTGSHFHKDKTPSTLKMIKDKHRENERLRHHSLNQHLRLICKRVPGSAEDSKETKVVMMQRIISYLSYLENTVRFMCSQIGIQADPSCLLLTSSVKDMERSGTWRREFPEDSRDSGVFSMNISRRLNLSSPTIDSTTDPAMISSTPHVVSQKSKKDQFEGCQESRVPTSSAFLSVDENWQWPMPAAEIIIEGSENFDALLASAEYDHNMFEPASALLENKLMKSPDEVKWLGSPDKSPSHLQGKSETSFGIKCDPGCLEEYELSDTVSISPDQVIPQGTVKEEMLKDGSGVASFSSSLTGKQIFITKHRQSSPKRAPLLNIMNWPGSGPDLRVESKSCKTWHPKYEDIVGSFTEVESYSRVTGITELESYSRVTGITEVESYKGFTEITKTEETNLVADRATSLQNLETRQVPRNASSQTKFDLRKSSWMNGFMMYSRIHRKQFIRANPGLHTAAISKMMGHTWRAMSNKQQLPYREHAQVCSQELHRVLNNINH